MFDTIIEVSDGVCVVKVLVSSDFWNSLGPEERERALERMRKRVAKSFGCWL